MKPLWENDPAAWRAKPLTERLEFLRKWYCTGPCGQSSSVLAVRETLSSCLKEAMAILRKVSDGERQDAASRLGAGIPPPAAQLAQDVHSGRRLGVKPAGQPRRDGEESPEGARSGREGGRAGHSSYCPVCQRLDICGTCTCH